MGLKQTTPTAAIAVIHRLHKVGWVHCDARAHNIVSDDAGAFLVDMATAMKATCAEARRADFAAYARSILKLGMWNPFVGWSTAFGEHQDVVTAVSGMYKESEENTTASIVLLATYLTAKVPA